MQDELKLTEEDRLVNRVSLALLGKYVEVSRGSRKNWSETLRGFGCEVLPYWELHEHSDDHTFVRDTAMGNIRVPREVAMKILALGGLP
jgi:hypothetical protein